MVAPSRREVVGSVDVASSPVMLCAARLSTEKVVSVSEFSIVAASMRSASASRQFSTGAGGTAAGCCASSGAVAWGIPCLAITSLPLRDCTDRSRKACRSGANGQQNPRTHSTVGTSHETARKPTIAATASAGEMGTIPAPSAALAAAA